jgi:hypothetical protein
MGLLMPKGTGGGIHLPVALFDLPTSHPGTSFMIFASSSQARLKPATHLRQQHQQQRTSSHLGQKRLQLYKKPLPNNS